MSQFSITIPEGLVQTEESIDWTKAVLFTLGWGVVTATVPSLVKDPKMHLAAMGLVGATAYAVGIFAAKKHWV